MLIITENVKGKRYNHLMDLLTRHCNKFAFVENEMEEESHAAIDARIVYIKEHLLERKIQREWETTKLPEATVYVSYFQLNNATRDFLKENSNSLFSWLHPKLPEDLMFYQNDKCILAGCSHEGYFIVEETLWGEFLLNTER